MNDLRYNFTRLFDGRTGLDTLSKTTAKIGLLLFLLTMLTHSNIVYVLALIFAAYTAWRVLSRNYQKRYSENQKFLSMTSGIRRRYNTFAFDVRNCITKARQRKSYVVFKCPNCKQKHRAPRGRGKIQVKCRNCRTLFIKKV
ncbi:MAG: hypothetical protein K5769_07950 [Pseudobutyrivibrio sp.]|nr:hypothetical protein [Pseudobutyrivibrio sp.]